ncbi:structural maintenance of chromosomes flexible hinge domain-containing protein 1-like [Babylonia areolata]|uniref:structural maintenance of chromosomes flexible hinge domain-containing protein 1-like n=1 Tax=Babylonia areolata TaxID=304850 RepID=UPI003FD2376C
MAAPRRQSDEEDAFVFVFDRRTSSAPEVKIPTGGLFTFSDFKSRVCAALSIQENESFVISTTNREEIRSDESWDLIDKGDTLYVLKDLAQELVAPAKERVNYLPHYDTIVKGGMYEYYASEGQNPLPYAFAELIDNSLAATAHNDAAREIEIRLHFDDSVPQRNCIIVIDNGKGMSPRQLNNWAIYRLSKFIRREKNFKGDTSADQSTEDLDSSESLDVPVARYMNSDISYFGVGGKQAIFFIGNSTRMISKPKGSFDVHELIISKEEFEKREKNNQSIYSGVIHNRKPGDTAHLSPEDDITARLIEEEAGRESFTAVVIQNVSPAHLPYLKMHFPVWTRQLSHIYHFYLHGPDGNVDVEEGKEAVWSNIDMKVKLFLKGQAQPRVIDLRAIEDDMQTLYARSAASTFEFKAIVDGSSAVEGMLRYHPFLYDRETFPSDAFDPRVDPEPEDDHGYAINEQRARGKRAVFECYWNGRLIPYTLIDEFDWCAIPKKNRHLPVECYNRISGVLWTNDTFQVSTNKLTFLDLEMKLRDKNTVFTRVVKGHDKRTQIDKEFTAWLRECHEKHDKQILFSGFKGVKTRSDLPRQKQFPWSFYTQVEWDNRTFKKGQMVKIQRAAAPLYGTIQCFMLYGDYDGDIFSTGGEMEIAQEPVSLYDEKKIVPLSKLDRTASEATIKYYIDEEMARLPSHLVVTWPNGMEVIPGEKRPAGQTIGDIKVEISNRRGELISKLPGSSAKKLLIELKVIWHSPHGDEVIVSHLSQHGKNWPYWFRKMENMKNIGGHTIQLQTVLNESGATSFAGHQLPSHRIKFAISEGEAERFTVGVLEGPFKTGVPFTVPLEFQDKYRNPAKPPAKLRPTLSAEGLELDYEGVQARGTTLFLKNVIAKGSVPSSGGKNFSLVVAVDDIKETQTLKIRLLPGPPATLSVSPKEDLTIENGTSAQYDIMVYDAAGNATGDGRQIVNAWVVDAPGVPMCTVNTSNTGVATLTTAPICLKKLTATTCLTARFELQNQKGVPTVERKLWVQPSGRASVLQVFRKSGGAELVQVTDDMEITSTVGDVITGLSFKLLDEADREITVTDKIAGKVKVNWVPRPGSDLLLKGLLPDIKVPTSVSDTKYCLVSFLDGTATECHFSVRGKAKAVSRLSCQVEGETSAGIGDPLPAVITVSLTDTYGNPVEIIKYTHCPTILTWQGDRIRSNGKFGGTMNKAVPLEKLRGAVFGEPLPMSYHALCTQIASLEKYRSALSRHMSAQDELQDVINAQKTPEMTDKFKECQEAENQLAQVERQLGVGLSSSKSRGSAHQRPQHSHPSPSSSSSSSSSSAHHENGSSGGPSPAKRSRLSAAGYSSTIPTASISTTSPLLPSAALNGSVDSDPSATPTRTSLRIRSMTTVVSDDGRKKLRKT